MNPLIWLALVVLLVASGFVRATSRNRHVRRRQRLTILLLLAWAALEVGLVYAAVPDGVAQQARNIGYLIVALAAINFVVVTGLNPYRHDRAPEHFPVILQDTLIVALFAAVATAILRERILALSAVSAVVLGFALQETIGNAFAGLAIQTEKPYDVGHWIRVADREGQVTEITWRATKLRTRDDSFLIVPNNVMAREVVLNYSEPVLPTRAFVEVGAAYDHSPGEVKAALREAMRNAPLVLPSPEPDVLLADFGSSSILYRARFWVGDYKDDDRARDQVRTAIWYAFKRRDIEIPFPIQIEYQREEKPPGRSPDATRRFALSLAAVDAFASLGDEERQRLAEAAAGRIYGAGEIVVRQDEPGSSMFVVCDGEVEVLLEPTRQRLATIAAPGFFGEMSLLTGATRSATVRATTDAILMEITADQFRQFVLERPSVLEPVTAAAMRRRAELERTRQVEQSAALTESAGSFLARVRRFLKLG